MLEYQMKANCMSSFMGLQKRYLGTTKQLTSLNWLKQKIMTGKPDIYCAEILFFTKWQMKLIILGKIKLNWSETMTK